MLYFLFLFNIIFALFLYFLLRRRLTYTNYLEKTLTLLNAEVEQLVLKLNQVSDRNISLLDSRIGTIKTLLARSNRVIDLLQREQKQNVKSAERYTEILNQVKEIQSQPAAEEEKKQQIQIAALKGMSSEQIARSFSLSVSEVELILSLAYPSFPNKNP